MLNNLKNDVMNEKLIEAYKEINRASDIVGDVMAGIYSGDEHDEVMENFLLAIDKANDELTKLVARCIRVKLDSFIIGN